MQKPLTTLSRIDGQVALVTGGTAGIGAAAALQLANQGAHVIITARDPKRGEYSIREIHTRLAGLGPIDRGIEMIQADFRSLDSVRKLADTFKHNYSQLNILVNNAGVLRTQRHTTLNGYEETFQVNYLAHFLLTNLLVDQLKTGAPSRMINVSSDAHNGARIHFNDLMGEKKYAGLRAYGQSKLANVLFTYELARRLKGTNITVNALHPGALHSKLGADEPGLFPRVYGVLKWFFTDPLNAARYVTYLACSQELEGVTGKYFVKFNETKSSKWSYDEATAHRLWRVSEELTGLKHQVPSIIA